MKKTAYLFSGQGSQYVGMGKSLYEKYEVARKTIDEANDVLGFDLKKLYFEGSAEELMKTENTQPALLTVSVAIFRVFMEEIGLEPAFLAGHSLGEFSALTCAGAINFDDCLKIVRQRGRFMQEAVGLGYGAMAAVSLVDKVLIEDECSKVPDSKGIVVVSNYNSPEQIVVSGNTLAVEQACMNLEGKGAKVIPLKVSAPFHSPLMQPAAQKLEGEMKKYNYNYMKWPVISNVTAIPYDSHNSIIDSLKQQIVKPVLWQSSMEYLVENGIELAVELSPKNVLKKLMEKNAPRIATYSVEKTEDITKIRGVLGVPEKRKLDRIGFITKCMAICVCTKNNNWNNEEYHKGVVEPYTKIKENLQKFEDDGKEPDIENVKNAFLMLKSVFETKKVSQEERNERYRKLLEETGAQELFPDLELTSETTWSEIG